MTRPAGPARRAPVMTPPVGMVMLFALLLVGVVTLVLIAIGSLSYAYARIGVGGGWMLVVLFAALVGSPINIPVATLPSRLVDTTFTVRRYGVTYRVPARVREHGTVVAVNVGGALVPLALAGYLIAHDHLGLAALWASLVVAALVFGVARPVPGIGIVSPALLAPVVAVLVAVALGGTAVAALAFVAGTLGTLIGADLLNLPRIRALGAPLVAIGGAGTFDGIFLSGVLAVLLATL